MKLDLSVLTPEQRKDLDIAFIIHRMGLAQWLDSLTDEQFEKLYNRVQPIWENAIKDRKDLSVQNMRSHLAFFIDNKESE